MSLKIVKNQYGLRVTCHKCKRDYNYEKVSRCSHPESQRYKSIVYMGEGVKVRIHHTKNYDEALVAAINFKKEVKSGALSLGVKNKVEKDPAQWTFYEAGNKFINFKHGINVPTHLKQNLSKKHLDSIAYYIKQFLTILKENGIDPKVVKMSSLDENHVDVWADFVRNHYSKGSWNAPLRILRMWVNYMISRKRVEMFNFFNDVKLVKVENKVSVLTKSEFESVCEAVNTASPYQYLNGETTKRKNRYKPFLVDMFKLMLYTGLRQEEVLSLTWNDIYNEEEGQTLITDNIKVERIMKQPYPKKYVPVHNQLRTFLNNLDWESNKGNDRYIIEPDRTATIKTMISYSSKGFTHFYKESFPARPVKNLNILRKTYLTYLAKAVGDKVVLFSSHNGMDILENHYLDKRILAKGREMKLF